VATSFWQLFLCRLGVGVGEAGGVAPSYALVTDYYPPEQRARALSIYSLGIPLGLAGGAFLGGYIAHAVQWRTAFVVAGMAGLLVVAIFKFIVRDLVMSKNSIVLSFAALPVKLRPRLSNRGLDHRSSQPL
jgi:MFS family permease